jgi:hypothetical protein
MSRKKSQPKHDEVLGDSVVERLRRFFRVLNDWDRDPGQRSIAVQQINDADLARWLSKTDKEGMRSAILAFLDKRAEAKKKADKVAKAKRTRNANEAYRRRQVWEGMATIPARPVTQEEYEAAVDRMRRWIPGQPYPK